MAHNWWVYLQSPPIIAQGAEAMEMKDEENTSIHYSMLLDGPDTYEIYESPSDEESLLIDEDDLQDPSSPQMQPLINLSRYSTIERFALTKNNLDRVLSFLSFKENDIARLAMTSRTMRDFIGHSAVGQALAEASKKRLSRCQIFCVKDSVTKGTPWLVSGISTLIGSLTASGSGALIAYASSEDFAASNAYFLLWVQKKYPPKQAAQIIAERTQILGECSLNDALMGAFLISLFYAFLAAVFGSVMSNHFCCQLQPRVFGILFLALSSMLLGLLLGFILELLSEASFGIFDDRGIIPEPRFAALFISTKFFPTNNGNPFYNSENMLYFIEQSVSVLALISGAIAGLTSSLCAQSISLCSQGFFKKQQSRMRRYSNAMGSIDEKRTDWSQNRNSLSLQDNPSPTSQADIPQLAEPSGV